MNDDNELIYQDRLGTTMVLADALYLGTLCDKMVISLQASH